MGGKPSKKKKAITLTFTKSELTRLQEAFNLVDENKDGLITIKELDHIMKKLNQFTTRQELEKIMAEVDLDNSGTIDFGEFLIMMKRYEVNKSREQEILEMFAVLDIRHTGRITAKDLKEAMRNVGEVLTDKDVEEMMEEADINQNGYITLEDFRLLCKRLSLV